MNQSNVLDLVQPQMVRIKVSAAWVSKEIGCAMPYIATHCGGGCCRSKAFYPPKSGGRADGKCARLTDTGCEFDAINKPLICLLYPLVIKNNTLVLHGRALLGCCKKNYKVGGLSIWEQNKGNLTILFGEEQWERVNESVKRGEDSWLELSDEFRKQQQIEHVWEQMNMIPDAVIR